MFQVKQLLNRTGGPAPWGRQREKWVGVTQKFALLRHPGIILTSHPALPFLCPSWTHRPTGLNVNSEPLPPPCPFQPRVLHEWVLPIAPHWSRDTSIISAPACSIIPLLMLKLVLRMEKENAWGNLILIPSYPNALHPSCHMESSCTAGTFLKSRPSEAEHFSAHPI